MLVADEESSSDSKLSSLTLSRLRRVADIACVLLRGAAVTAPWGIGMARTSLEHYCRARQLRIYSSVRSGGGGGAGPLTAGTGVG